MQDSPVNSESPIQFIRHTAFGRMLFDIGWILQTKRGEALTEKDYIDGLVAERKSLLRASNILFFGSICLALLLAATAGKYNISLSLVGLQVSGVPLTSDLLVVATSLTFGMHVSYTLSFYALDAVLRKLHSTIGSQHEIHIIHRVGHHSLNLLLDPRTTGYVSGLPQLIIVTFFVVLFFLLYFVLLAIPVVAIFQYSVGVLWTDAQFTMSDLGALFSLGVLAAFSISLLLVLFPFKYRWRETD